jgi:hypothetical protein
LYNFTDNFYTIAEAVELIRRVESEKTFHPNN